MSDTPHSDGEHRGRDEEEAVDTKVLPKHLPTGYSAGIASVTPTESRAGSILDGEESSLRLQGGDIHRDLFKMDAKAHRAGLHKRAATMSAVPRPITPAFASRIPANSYTATEQRVPGGFRRQFILRHQHRLNSVYAPVTKNFVEFLDLYGSFAGEDLAESDDEADHAEEQGEATETRPLLGRRQTTRGRKTGDASQTKTFFTLLKAFIGTGILFLPKAFNNGGLLFSSITLVVVSLVTTLCFRLLLQCKTKYSGGYGELGGAIGGKYLSAIILGSVTLSQIGFVCAGIIFTAQNMHSFAVAVAKGPDPISSKVLIALQVVILIPLALIRNISKLGGAALLADVCILIGLSYIYYYTISTISGNGIAKSVVLFNPNSFPLTIGSAIFTFEGIGLLLPIQTSMKEPQKFEKLLYIVMGLITVVFTAVGALAYAAFGSATKIEVISNFPQDSKLVNAIQFIYSFAVLVGTPIQLFPPVRIVEGQIFGYLTGKKDTATKWKKNAFRAAAVIFCGLIAWVGADDLDKFVALIGSFACIPLVYIYPPLLHYKAMASNRWESGADIAMMVVGVVAMVYTTSVTVSQWVST